MAARVREAKPRLVDSGDWHSRPFGTEQKTIGPDSPTVLSLYAPFYYPGLPTNEQGTEGPTELLSTPFADYERMIREQFTDMFARSGFDAKQTSQVLS